jgi:hypothetical protein
MKKLNILYTFIDVCYKLSILGTIAIILFTPMAILGGLDLPTKISNQIITQNDWMSNTVIISSCIATIFFTYSIYILRKAITQFKKRVIFSEETVVNFRQISIYLICSTLLDKVPLFFYTVTHKDRLGMEVETVGFNSFLFEISIALFFMVLSEIFKIAKNMKEENELTV